MNSKRTEKGQAIIIIVLSIIGLIGITALAVDGGNAFVQQRNAQSVADSIALGAAVARIKSNSTWVKQAYAIAEQNGFTEDNPAKNVRLYSPPSSGPYANNIEYIQVILTARTPTYFGGAVGVILSATTQLRAQNSAARARRGVRRTPS